MVSETLYAMENHAESPWNVRFQGDPGISVGVYFSTAAGTIEVSFEDNFADLMHCHQIRWCPLSECLIVP